MAKMEIAKITSLLFGDVASEGAMQTEGNMAAIGVIKEGTATLNLAEPDTTDINIEESDTAYASKKGSAERDLTVTLLGIEAENLADILGATYTAATASDPEKIEIPASTSDVLKSVMLKGENVDAEDVVIAIPKANIIVSSSGTITKSDVAGWTLKCKIMQPVNSSGTPTSPYQLYAGEPTT